MPVARFRKQSSTTALLLVPICYKGARKKEHINVCIKIYASFPQQNSARSANTKMSLA
jgi:hypothetical protein